MNPSLHGRVEEKFVCVLGNGSEPKETRGAKNELWEKANDGAPSSHRENRVGFDL